MGCENVGDHYGTFFSLDDDESTEKARNGAREVVKGP